MNKKYSKKYIIETGIGLQNVDNLKNSDYFISESNKYVKGEITLDELDKLINSYYKHKDTHDKRDKEADIVATRIAKLISEDSFTFSTGQLLSIHKSLFKDVLAHPGKLRQYNISKKEWVLNGASVTYGDFRQLENVLQYDFEEEKKFNYKNLSINEIIEHLAIFISNLWQNHVFEEGNTRTVAVFLIKYLRSLGFNATNDTFAKYSYYFRNSLVRANYSNIPNNIYEDRSYLILFLRNLLLNEKNELKNRYLLISNVNSKKEDSSEDKLLKLIKSNPKITSNELANELNVSVRTVKYLLRQLVDKKVIIRKDGKRYGYWG